MRASVVAQAAQQIVENRGAGADGRGIAVAYNDLCVQVNERLARCAGLARDGRLVESVHLADQPPALLDLCATLDFARAEEWRSISAKNGWPVAPAIDAGAIRVLNDAYGAGIPLAPLLQEYRTVMRTRNRQAAIPLLRRLVQVEPSNPAWKEDLAAFETRRLEEIGAAVDALDAAGDAAGLTVLADELGAVWSQTVPPELLERTKRALRSAERRQAEAEARGLLDALQRAFENRDLAKTEAVLGSLVTLIATYGVAAEADHQALLDRSRTWVEAARAAEAEDCAWQEALERLTQAVEAGDGGAVEVALDGLARFTRAVPEGLDGRARELAESHRLAQDRVYRLRVGGSLAAVLVVMIGCAVVYLQVSFQRRVRDTATELEDLYTAGDLNGMTNRLNAISSQQPRVWKAAEIQAWTPKVDAMVEDWRRSAARAEALLRSVEAWIQVGFPDDPEAVDRSLAETRKVCNHPAIRPELHARVTHVVQAWSEEIARRRMNTSERWQTAEVAAKEALAIATAAVSSGKPTKEVNDAVDRARECTAVTTRLGAGNERQVTAEALANALALVRVDLQERERLTARIRTPDTITTWFEAIAVLQRAYPEHPWVSTLAPYVARRTDYEALAAGPVAAVAGNRFWNDAIVHGPVDREKLADRWVLAKVEMLNWADEPLMVDVWEWRVGQKRILLRGKPERQGEDYVISSFEPMANSRTAMPEFRTGRIQNPKGEMHRLSYCAVVEEIIGQLRQTKVEDAQLALRQAMHRIATTPADTLPPVLQARLIEGLLQQAQKVFGEREDPSWPELIKQFGELDHDISWLCQGYYGYGAASKAAGDVVKLVTRDPALSAVQRELIDAGRLRGVRLVGIVPPDGATNTLPAAAATCVEIWGMRQNGDAGERIFVLAEKRSDGKFAMRAGLRTLPGEPMFAPEDKRSTTEHAVILAKKAGTDVHSVVSQMVLSPMWPANATE